MGGELKDPIRELAEALAAAKVETLTCATVALLAELLAALAKSGAISKAEAIAIPTRLQLAAATQKSDTAALLTRMTMEIQNALIDDVARKPN